MRRTAFIAKPAISKTRTKISPGFRRKAAAARIIRTCDPHAPILPSFGHRHPFGARILAGPSGLCACGRGAKSTFSPRPSTTGAPDSRFAGPCVYLWRSRDSFAAVAACRHPRHGPRFELSILGRAGAAQEQLSPENAAGSYLAARHAGAERDSARAAAYYRGVLRLDPRNPDLLNRTFLSVLTEGSIDEASKLGERLLAVERSDRISRLVLGVRDIKQKRYASARQHLAQSVRGPVTDLTAALLSAWAHAGAGDSRGAVESLDKLSGPDWYGIFKDLHAGLILDLANDKKGAAKRFASAYKADPQALRTVQGYGRYLSRNGSKDDALKVYSDFAKALPDHPVVSQ